MSDNGSSNVKRTVEDSSQDRSFREEESSSSKRVRTESHEYSGVDFDTDAEAQLRCLMKTGDAGAIIGKAGSNVKRLRSDYSLSITLPNSMSVERVLTMRGSIKNIGNCLQDCFRLIHEDKMPDIDFKVECRMLVHSPFVGGLIGFKGERIKEIRERSNVEIKIFEDCCPGSTERVFKIDGSVSVVISSIMYILHLLNKPEIRARGRRLQEYDPLNNADLNDSAFRSQLSSSSYTHRSFADDITAPPKSFNHRGREADPREAPVFLEDAEGPVTSLTLTVAAESAGAIIGTGGRNINVARQRSRADIRVEDGKHDGAPRQVTITGTDSQIHYAKFLIQQFVKEDRAGRQKDTGRGDRDRERPETVPVGKAPPRSAAMGVPPGVKRGTDPRRGSSGSAAPPRLPSNGTGRGAANGNSFRSFPPSETSAVPPVAASNFGYFAPQMPGQHPVAAAATTSYYPAGAVNNPPPPPALMSNMTPFAVPNSHPSYLPPAPNLPYAAVQPPSPFGGYPGHPAMHGFGY